MISCYWPAEARPFRALAAATPDCLDRVLTVVGSTDLNLATVELKGATKRSFFMSRKLFGAPP